MVYIDANDNGVLDSGELSTVTQAGNPTASTNQAGDYSFSGLAPGTYVVREQVPTGSAETAPSSSSVTNTIDFDGTGAELGITKAGVTSFTFQGASFSGGTIFAPSQSALYASASLAYNATSGSAQVLFSTPISSVKFFYVSGDGFAAGTATAFGPDGSNLGSVNSNPVTTSGATGNFVTMSYAAPIAEITFSGGAIDNFSFTTVANDPAQIVHVGASQTVNGINFGNKSTVASTDLVATNVTPTTTGFTATFSAPLNPSVLNLYDTGTMGTADATLVGQSTGPVTGSLVLSNNNTTVTFIKTAGLLAADTYTITLNSGANAFETTTGALLDGNGDGTPGDNLTYSFTVSPLPSNAVVVSIPNFTRGYGQPVNVPASSTSGLPITLSTGTNVTGVDLTLLYNPALLTLSSFTTSISGASALMNVTTPGTAIITISSPNAFSTTAGSITLGDLTASVPNNAPYGSKEILQITNLSVFDNAAIPQPLPAVAQNAIHIAAYFGDTNDDQSYNTPDVTLEQRYIGLINNGFPAFPMADPNLIGDITLNGLIQANDTTSIQRVVGLVNVPNIPALPTGLAPAPSGGPDPTIFIPTIHANPGDTITVPVEMTVTESAGITVSGFQIAIAYDPSVFTVSPVAQLGSMFSSALGFSPYPSFPAPGELIFQAESPIGTDTIPYNTTTELFSLSFTVKATAPNGTSVINLMQNIQTADTAIFDDNLVQLTLSPAPTNAATDSVDGIVSIGIASTSTAASNASATFSTAAQDVALGAMVTSPAGTVDEGSVTFQLFDSSNNPIGSPVTVNVSGGIADISNYLLPADTPDGTYEIQAVYDGTTDFATSTDTSHTLIVSGPSVSVSGVSAEWGSETVPLQTAADGLRLLPTGRKTDLPWFNINRVAIALGQSAVVNPGDVTVTGIVGGNYGPVTISGSGTSTITITFAKVITVADRVTITIGNAQVISYTRRLDVLPGDVNDDGVVNTTDGVLILDNETPAHAYKAIYDMNGDGSVTTADFTLYRPKIGTVLPSLSAQLAAQGPGPGDVAPLTPDALAPVLDVAIEDWASAGLPAQDVARLHDVTVLITTLSPGYLGGTIVGGNTVELSANADGYGWSIDPSTNPSFARPAASLGKEDLLTVVMHELGHVLGLNDLNPAAFPDDLMAETLATGVRRMPSAQDVAMVLAAQSVGERAATPSGTPDAALVDIVLGALDPGVLAPPTSSGLATATGSGGNGSRVRGNSAPATIKLS